MGVIMTDCPRCHRRDCPVREAFAQATRTEPMRSLGFHAYCATCAVSFPANPNLLQITFLDQVKPK